MTLFNRVYVATATTGTGAITPGAAQSGYQDFTVLPSTATVSYTIIDGTAWECGHGTWNGTTMARSLLSSSTTALLSLSGSATIFLTMLAEDYANWSSGNSTVNASANSTSEVFSDTSFTLSLTTSTLVTGNSTANALINTTSLQIINSTATMTLHPNVLSAGNTTVNAQINSSAIVLNGSNTLSLGSGSFSKTANGYTFLPNGIVIQWGWTVCNTTSGNITFPLAFPTQLAGITATANTANGTGISTFCPILIASNTTTANLRCANVITTAVNTHYMAIGW